MTQHLRCSAFALLLLVGLSSAVELENWRLQYYLLAAEVDALASSPSGMFWDDLRVTDTTLFGGALCPRSPGQAVGYWHVEPVVGGLASTDRYVDGQHVAAVADLTSDVRYGNLLARNTLNVDSRYKNDPDYVWKTDRVAAGRIEEAYLQIDHRYGFVRFGRLKRNWGPFADRSLLLSSNPHTYDALEWSVAGRFFEFRHLFAAFDRAHSTIDTDSSATGRYLAAHSLNLMFGGWATLGVTESVVFGCREGLPDFQYVNPFSIYTVTNTNAESNANLMLAFQWKVYPFTKRLSLAGQVLIDDIQVDNKTIGDQEPAHWGLDAAMHWYDPLPGRLQSSLKLEYTYRSRWLYLVAEPGLVDGERYTYLGRSLGLAQNDGDRWRLTLTMLGHRWWAATVGGGYSRAGGNTVTSPWQTGDTAHPDAGYNGYRHETSLRSDSVEQTIEFSGRGYVWLRDWADLSVGLTNRWVKNRNNRRTEGFDYDPALDVSLTLHYAGLYWVFREGERRQRRNVGAMRGTKVMDVGEGP